MKRCQSSTSILAGLCHLPNGGAIPLEALRLGCDALALDLNPVAHLIQLCTLAYPQQYGKPDPAAVGSAADGTWAGLAREVEHWGQWVLDRLQVAIADLYPPIPDPRETPDRRRAQQLSMAFGVPESRSGYRRANLLTPVAYLWTRTVRCKNPACGATVSLARQIWLAQKEGRYIAVRADIETNRSKGAGEKRVVYRVVEARDKTTLGFDPEAGSKAGNATCPFCGTVVDSDFVKLEGQARRIGCQPMAAIFEGSTAHSRLYLGADELPLGFWPDEESIRGRIDQLKEGAERDPRGPLSIPDEPLPLVDARGAFFVKLYGYQEWGQLFTARQLLCLLTYAANIRLAHSAMSERGYDCERARAVATCLALAADRLADWNSAFCTWAPEKTGGAKIRNTFARQALPMVWDFVESGVFGNATGSAALGLEWVVKGLREAQAGTRAAIVKRGSATESHWEPESCDAVITDPPYYDNVPYADLSDFFYAWLKRSVGFLYPEHFSAMLAPKKMEAIMDAGRHGKNKDAARSFYEQMMLRAFSQAAHVLKPSAPLVVVYAHKTTFGWSTLVDAMRGAGFVVTEAWPLDTEMATRPRALDSAALASSIFMIARRRDSAATGSYEREVVPELDAIVKERLDTLWSQGVTGANLVIACVGAGLRAFTRFARVEYANGEPVPADSFLGEVEGAVLEGLLEKLFGVSRAGIGRLDAATNFYVLWRYAYRTAALDAGEAIVFAYPQRVELDGPHSLSAGRNPLVQKQKGTYRLRDFRERGEDEDLGLPDGGERPPMIDVLHRLLWLVENRPLMIPGFLDQAQPDVERLRVVAQTLAGQALAGNGSGGGKSLVAARGAEASALRKLTTSWRTLIEAHRGPLT